MSRGDKSQFEIYLFRRRIADPANNTIDRMVAAGSVPGADKLRQRARDENFPVALTVLPRDVRADLYAVYAVARTIDDIGDLSSGDRVAALQDFQRELHELWRSGTARRPVLQNLAQSVCARRLPIEPFDCLIEANRIDQQVTRYDTFDELIGYCRLSADPVGRLVLHIFEQSSSTTIAMSDQICRALQLLEHWQDVAEDRRAGRIYLPQRDLRDFGVSESDLDRPRASPALRELIAFETARAADLLSAGTPILTHLHGWARIAVTGYIAGGRAAVRSLSRVRWDVLGARPKARRSDVAISAAALLAHQAFGHWRQR